MRRTSPSSPRVFHQWVPLCSFRATVVGDYYLQVRTNVPMRNAGRRPRELQAAGTQPRARHVQHRPATTPSVLEERQPTGTRFGRMGHPRARYRCRPTARCRSSPMPTRPLRSSTWFGSCLGEPASQLIFKFYDVGDATAASGATMSVLRPTEATGSAHRELRGDWFQEPDLPNVFDQRHPQGPGLERTGADPHRPDPQLTTAATTLSPGGCWFRVQMNFGSGTVTDATTWSASISGDPVRLIE